MKQVLIFITMVLLLSFINPKEMPNLVKHSKEEKCKNNTHYDSSSGKCVPNKNPESFDDKIDKAMKNFSNTFNNMIKNGLCPKNYIKKCITTITGKKVCNCQKNTTSFSEYLESLSETLKNIKKKLCLKNQVRKCTTALNGKKICKCEKNNSTSNGIFNHKRNNTQHVNHRCRLGLFYTCWRTFEGLKCGCSRHIYRK